MMQGNGHKQISGQYEKEADACMPLNYPAEYPGIRVGLPVPIENMIHMKEEYQCRGQQPQMVKAGEIFYIG
jgi:hypothetical protein